MRTASECPPDAKLVTTDNKRHCQMRHYRSALIREAFAGAGGPWNILVTLYSSATGRRWDGVTVTDIAFANVKPGNRSIEC